MAKPGRVRLKDRDRLFWIWLRRAWPSWHRALILVQPATVVKWHRKGFRAYWSRKSQPRRGRPGIDPQLRKLIRDMWRANPTWGKPRIQAELRKIGLEVSDSTVRRYRPPRSGPPSQSWRSFLENHVRDIAALDFFVVPTATFRVLYVLVIMSHDRRRMLHFGSIRRECLDHVVVLGERHLMRVLRSYASYHHSSRTHRSLDNDCPDPRGVEPPEMGDVVALAQVGGLHHRYTRQLAA